MKTIGIKLADGTFYPVLEEGEPKKRMLDLTTAKDNQTKVQIDLYRSENGTMEDAEYVDTLEVTKLNPHPNGEPELHLSVGLDEENHLTAEVVDPETGKKSETEVTLVSRTEAERAEPADYSIAGAAVAATTEEATFTPEELPETGRTSLDDMPSFSFDHSELASTEASLDSSSDKIDGALPDFSALDKEIPVEDKTLESVDFSKETIDDVAKEDVIGTESPDLGTSESEVQTDTTTIAEDSTEDFTADTFSLPDFDESTDSAADTDSTVASDDLPDFGDDFGASSDSADTTSLTDDLPDFGDDFESTEKDSSDSSDVDEFALPDFDSDFNSDSSSESTDSFFDDLGTGAAASTGSAMDFSDLYDKETLAGEHASLYDEEEEEKKTRTPVIICIICAIICVIATILLLFVVPSKYNLIASRNTNGVSILDKFFSKTEKVVETQAEETKEDTKFIDVVVEEPKNEAPEAVEDKIVIAPEPEKVVPKPAPVEERKPEVKKSSAVKYHIRWGDTLWDISESYYKTPWKYPKIADYNKIKNPDLIISGTDILIPAE